MTRVMTQQVLDQPHLKRHDHMLPISAAHSLAPCLCTTAVVMHTILRLYMQAMRMPTEV